MSETGTVDFKDEDGETFASVTVGIAEIGANDPLGIWPGFYFTFPDPQPGLGETVTLHGPYESREKALEEAGSFLLDVAETEAAEVLAQNPELPA
jgi:hypothetical protein